VGPRDHWFAVGSGEMTVGDGSRHVNVCGQRTSSDTSVFSEPALHGSRLRHADASDRSAAVIAPCCHDRPSH